MFNAKASFMNKTSRYSTPKTFHTIPIENITYNLINQPRLSYSEKKYELLKKSIQAHGITTPVTIFTPSIDGLNSEDIKGDLLDGFNRLKIAKELGIKKIPALVETSANEADKIVLISNTNRSNLHPIECGRLINDSVKKGIISTISTSDKYQDIEHYLGWKKPTSLYYESLANNIFEDVARVLISIDFRNKEKLLKIAKICRTEELRVLGGDPSESLLATKRAIEKTKKLIDKTRDNSDDSFLVNTSRAKDSNCTKTHTHNRILFLKDGKGELIGENMLERMSPEELSEIISMSKRLNDICSNILNSKA